MMDRISKAGTRLPSYRRSNSGLTFQTKEAVSSLLAAFFVFFAGFTLTKSIIYVIFVIEVIDMSEYLVPISIEYLQEGQYLATSSVLQGLIAQGRTIAETIEIAEDVARKIIESCIQHGDRLPKNLAVGQRQP